MLEVSVGTPDREPDDAKRAVSPFAALVGAVIFFGLLALYILGLAWARGYTVAYLVYIFTSHTTIDERSNLGLVITIGFAIGGTPVYAYFKNRLQISLDAYRRSKLEGD